MKIKPPAGKQLVKEIEAHLPLPVYATPELSRSLREQGKRLSVDEEMKVISVFDSGDMGGILCAIDSEKSKEAMVISLTHLRIAPDHPLRERIEAYQRARVRSLRWQR